MTGESAIPVLATPAARSLSAMRPVPMENASAGPPAGSDLSRGTMGPITPGAKMQVPGVS